MKIEFNTLYWDNTPAEIIDNHKKVVDYFNIPVNYYGENTRHGQWMDRVCNHSSSDIIGFFDSDCIPLSKEKIVECVQYVAKTSTFLGIAQVSNHILPKSHVYAAPAFFLTTKKCWESISTSFLETRRSDVGEEFCYNAENKGIRYRCLYPTSFDSEPVEGVWPLGNYGYYGIGTVFDNTVFHLYQVRTGNNIEKFVDTCDKVLKQIPVVGKYSSRTYSYPGVIVP